MATFRSGTVTNTSTNIKTTGADVYKINIVNRHSAVVYVKFYNSTVATFQDTPVAVIAIPATSSVVQVSSLQQVPLIGTSAGLCVRATTDATDNGNTAAATLPVIEVTYN